MPPELGLDVFQRLVWLWVVVPLALVWTMVWKGIALWRAGRNGHLVWFIVIFIINTLGILEIIYIFAFSRRED